MKNPPTGYLSDEVLPSPDGTTGKILKSLLIDCDAERSPEHPNHLITLTEAESK
jgi:hypothetical protein